jgi:hypothetical protein
VTAASPLELLHPAGRVERVLVLGRLCPPSLVPPLAEAATADAELVLVAPSPAELRQSGWLEHAATKAAAALAPHGVAYALLPRRKRVEGRGRLRHAGLVVDQAVAHFPGTGPPRYLLPIQDPAWTYAMTHGIGSRPVLRRGLVAARSLPYGTALLELALPAVGIVGRLPGADPLAAWVDWLGDRSRPVAQVVVATSWRAPQGPTVVYCLGPGSPEPWGVAKVAADSAAEARWLDELGDAARAAGSRVPHLLAKGEVGARPVLVESLVAGVPAAILLGRHPARFADLARALVDWQERWGGGTSVSVVGDHELIERELTAPARELEGRLPDGPAYRRWLEARARALAGKQLTLVARHNDLTMWNVVLDGHRPIGVLDWAQAERAGLPMTDFYYSVADAAAACDGYRSRLDAVRSCFTPRGDRAGVVTPLRDHLSRARGLNPEVLELAFHACWLRHARNEQRERKTVSAPFLEIASWLVRSALEDPA